MATPISACRDAPCCPPTTRYLESRQGRTYSIFEGQTPPGDDSQWPMEGLLFTVEVQHVAIY